MENKIRCEMQDKEIQDIRTEFGSFKKDVSSKLDELFEELRKPLFTNTQIIGAIASLMLYTFYITNHISKIDTRSENNQVTIKQAENNQAKLLEYVIIIKEDIATIKAENKGK